MREQEDDDDDDDDNYYTVFLSLRQCRFHERDKTHMVLLYRIRGKDFYFIVKYFVILKNIIAVKMLN